MAQGLFLGYKKILFMDRLREVIREGILPEPYSVYHGVTVYRCETDGALVAGEVGRRGQLRRHVGHRLKSPVVLTFWEKLLIWLKIIR